MFWVDTEKMNGRKEMFLITWLKTYGAKKLIKEMDQLEPLLASKLREAQEKFGKIPPDEFAKVLVDEIQIKMCNVVGVDPVEVLK